MTARDKLTGSRDYYVRTDGSNANNGLTNTSGGAWATLQYAAEFIRDNLDLSGFDVIVNVAAGSYSAGAHCDGTWVGGGEVVFEGPGTVRTAIITSSDICFEARNGAIIRVLGGFEFRSEFFHLHATRFGSIYFQGVCFDQIVSEETGSHIYATRFGYVEATESYLISAADSVAHFNCTHSGNIRFGAGTCIFANETEDPKTITFDRAFAYALAEADITLTGTANFFLQDEVSVVGHRFEVDAATLLWSGQSPDALPGSGLGIEMNGGRFIDGTAQDVRIGTTTYDLASPNLSTLIVTSLGHIPGEIDIEASVDGEPNWSSGWFEGGSTGAWTQNSTFAAGGDIYQSSTAVISYVVNFSDYVTASVTARGAGQFTLTFSKAGSPTGTLKLRYKSRRAG